MVSRDELEQAVSQMHSFVMGLLTNIPRDLEIEDVYQDLMSHVVKKCYAKFDPTKSKLTTFVGYVAKWRMSELRRQWAIKINEITNLDNDPEDKVRFGVVPYAREIIWKLSKDIPPKQRMVVRNKADGLTEEEIGKRLGITRQAVSLLLKKAINEMRQKGKEYVE